MNDKHSRDRFLEEYKDYIWKGGRKAGQRPPFPPGLDDPCKTMNVKELCDEFIQWGTEVSEFLWEIYEDLYGGEPGTVDPPPKPPFKG